MAAHLFGRYVIDRKLTQGGMAELFLARRCEFGSVEKRVVVKTILPELASRDEFVHMLINEARLASQLDHPNLVRIYDLGREAGRPYIVMEYLHGESALAMWRRSGDRAQKLPPGVVCRILCELLSGLAYAHAQTGSDGRSLGLVHRDVSPGNIVCTFAGAVKLIDFGIAKATHALETPDTRAGELKGKCAYMAPEQVAARPLDGRTDVFAAGIVLWELLTGCSLFGRPTPVASMMAVCGDPIPPVTELDPLLPPELDAVLCRALCRAPEDRYPTAGEMRDDLQRVAASHGWDTSATALSEVLHGLFIAPPLVDYDDAPTAVASPSPSPPICEAATAILSPPVLPAAPAARRSELIPLPAAAPSRPASPAPVTHARSALPRRARATSRWRRIAAIAALVLGLGALGGAAVAHYATAKPPAASHH